MRQKAMLYRCITTLHSLNPFSYIRDNQFLNDAFSVLCQFISDIECHILQNGTAAGPN